MRRVTLFETIHDVDESAWNRLGDDALSRHEVYRALEEVPPKGLKMHYALLWDQGGEPVAAASFADLPLDAERLTHSLFRRIIHSTRKIAPGFMRARLLICGTPLSVGNPAFRLAESADPRPVARQFAGLLHELACAAGVRWQVFKELDTGGNAAAKALESAGLVVAPSEDDWVLPLNWASAAGWLADMRSHYRTHILRDRQNALQSGLRCERLPLVWFEPAWHRFYEEVHDRADIALERLEPGFFSALGRAVGQGGILLRFHVVNRTVGFVVLIRNGGRLHDLFHGLDGVCNATRPLYFYQLYETIRFGLESGARVLYLGQSCGRVKSRFGARPRPLKIALRHTLRPVNGLLARGRDRLFPEPARLTRRVFRCEEPVGVAR